MTTTASGPEASLTLPKIALVTGASRGLGRSMARHLARAGIGVIGTYHSRKDEAEDFVGDAREQGVPAACLQLDLGDSGGFAAFAESVRTALAGFGATGVHYLVNNAGTGVYAPFAGTDEERFDDVVRVQFKGPFFLTQALLPLIVDGGRILNVSSGLARFTLPGYSAYAAAKGAVEVLTRYQAAELAPRGIRVNVLAPGAVATDFGGGAVRDNAEVNAAVAAAIALGRVGRADDIGAAVPHILSDDFGWANGTRIELSGGQSL
jgi:NAD(P)-dependent dehydrogenase (short-subunit alcohol dehydrogenase family)